MERRRTDNLHLVTREGEREGPRVREFEPDLKCSTRDIERPEIWCGGRKDPEIEFHRLVLWKVVGLSTLGYGIIYIYVYEITKTNRLLGTILSPGDKIKT